ncbi:hypothetical protein, partial [Deinococcus marmoris]|uniref:hypothetical protein n=1 Tax=Deinococcus marmoris TaxID=249408 RepID=UPI0039F0C5CC
VKASLKDQAIGAKSVLDAPTLSDSTPQVPLLSSYFSSILTGVREGLDLNLTSENTVTPTSEEAVGAAWARFYGCKRKWDG